MELDLIAVLRKKMMEDQKIRQQVEKRAFEIYLARGCVDGRHQEDWIKAEDEILTPLIRESLRPATTSRRSLAQQGSAVAREKKIKKSLTSLAPKKKGTRSPKETLLSAIQRAAEVTAKQEKPGKSKLAKRKEARSVQEPSPVQTNEGKLAKTKLQKSGQKIGVTLPEHPF